MAIVALGVLLIAVPLPVGALQRDSRDAVRDQGSSPPVEVPATAEELGRLLFFDPRLSGDAQVSCASCHVPDRAWADGLPLSIGYTSTLYFRNTPTLLNAAQMPLLDWDGRFAGADMNSLIRDHLTEAHFMNVDGRLMVERLRQVPEYEQGFAAAFDDGDVTFGRTLSALAAFVATLSSEDHPYQSYLDGDTDALSPEAGAGLVLFQGKAGCAQCHGGPLLSDGELHVLGTPENRAIFEDPLRHITFRRFFRAFGVSEYATMREDPGLYALTFDEDDRGAFRTPSLLEVARTAPYMHNGIFDSLEDVVRFYDEGGGEAANKDVRLQPLGLTADEIASLVAFLESLRSEEAPSEALTCPPYQPETCPPYGLRTLGEN